MGAEDLRSGGALRDLAGAARGWRVWWGLAVQDIEIRYRRTVLGPLWIGIGQAVTFVFLGMLFSAVLKTDVRAYLPHLAIGLVTWSLLQGAAVEAPRVFISAHHIIDSLRMPLASHVLRTLVRHLLIYGHTLATAVVATVILAGPPDPLALLQLPFCLLLLLVLLFPVMLVLAVLGARFRDLGPVIEVLSQVLFFMTPIMWRVEDLPLASKWWIAINPLHHLLMVVRAPLLGGTVPRDSVLLLVALAAGLNLVAVGLFAACRRRVPYWL